MFHALWFSSSNSFWRSMSGTGVRSRYASHPATSRAGGSAAGRTARASIRANFASRSTSVPGQKSGSALST